MSEIATSVAAAVEQQGKATAEIARNIQQAAAGTQEVSSHIVGVTAAADESGKTAADVLGSTARLTASRKRWAARSIGSSTGSRLLEACANQPSRPNGGSPSPVRSVGSALATTV